MIIYKIQGTRTSNGEEWTTNYSMEAESEEAAIGKINNLRKLNAIKYGDKRLETPLNYSLVGEE